MQSVRNILKTERRKKGLTVLQVSEQTKIPIHKLEALENGNYDEFDSEVYLKGFLRNYIKFLGLDIDKTMAIYRRERGLMEEQIISAGSESEEKPAFVLTPTKVTVSLIVIVIVAVVTFVAIQVNRIVKPPELTLTAPVSAQAPAEQIYETDQPTINISGVVESGSILKINGNTVNTNNLQEFQLSDFVLESGNNKIVIEAENQFLKKNMITLNVVRTTEGESEIQNFESNSSEEVQEFITSFDVSIEIFDEPSWLIVTIDDVQALATVAQPGEKFDYTPGDSFVINTPRPHGMKITVNEEEVVVPPNIDTGWKLIDGEVQTFDPFSENVEETL